MTTSGEQFAADGEASWRPTWMSSREFPLRVGALQDLSVSAEVEVALRRSRWVGCVGCALPTWYEDADQVGLMNFIDAHLRGRNPIAFVDDQRRLTVSFIVEDSGPETEARLQAFAQSFVSPAGFGQAGRHSLRYGIGWLDTSEYEAALPREFRSDSSD